MIIKATDKGTPSKSSYPRNAKVTIVITDAKDHSPKFTNEPYKKTINESVDIGTSVITVTATDVDTDKLTYKIVTSNVPFVIDAVSGLITTSGVIDRETVTIYTIVVEVSDGINKDDSLVTITIGDLNDNKPVVDDITKTFPENQPIDTVLLTVVGTDKDEGDNAKLIHQIESGNGNAQFEMVSYFYKSHRVKNCPNVEQNFKRDSSKN